MALVHYAIGLGLIPESLFLICFIVFFLMYCHAEWLEGPISMICIALIIMLI